jgi:hypothetical protein
MSSTWPISFTQQLIGDHVLIRERLEKSDTQSNRREFIRATFAAVEGLLWQLKTGLTLNPAIVGQLTHHEFAALQEETYFVDDRGKVRPQPRFLPISTSIRLVVDLIQKFRPQYQLDFTHMGWQCLRNAVDVRNRIVHPKELSELTISDSDVRDCGAGFAWFLAFVIEVMQEHVDHAKSVVALAAFPGSDPSVSNKG